MCTPILIKAISTISLSFVGFSIVLFRYFKKIDGYKMELVLGIVICGALLLFSAQSFYRAMNPNLKTIVAEYMSHDRSRYSIGMNYYFSGEDQELCLYIDPLTARKYIGNNELEKGKEYIITYETNEDMFNQLKAGGVQYDLVCPSEYMIDKLIQNDMLEKLKLTYSCYLERRSLYNFSQSREIALSRSANSRASPVYRKRYQVLHQCL